MDWNARTVGIYSLADTLENGNLCAMQDVLLRIQNGVSKHIDLEVEQTLAMLLESIQPY